MPIANIILNIQPAESWVTIVFLAILSLIAWVRYRYRKYWANLFKGLVNFNLFKQQLREEEATFHRQSFIVSFISLTIGALFATLCVNQFYPSWGIEMHMIFLLLFFAIALFHFIKSILVHISGYLLGFSDLAAGNIYLNYLFYSFTGVVLLPITIVAFYAATLPQALIVKMGAAIFAAIYCGRLAKISFHIIRSSNISLLHFILYICTLEILPLVVIIKVFIEEIL